MFRCRLQQKVFMQITSWILRKYHQTSDCFASTLTVNVNDHFIHRIICRSIINVTLAVCKSCAPEQTATMKIKLLQQVQNNLKKGFGWVILIYNDECVSVSGLINAFPNV